MAQCGIREYTAKSMMAEHWARFFSQFPAYPGKLALLGPDGRLDDVAQDHPWLKKDKLTAKPDMLFGKRSKLGLLKLNADFFASHRSAFAATMECIENTPIKTVAVIAEGIPERHTCMMNVAARKTGK